MNDIYAYFDYHGTLKERVSAPVRANSTQVNSIYAYWDNQSVEPVTYSVTWRLVGSDSFETTSEHYAETLAIPANYLRRRDLVFFKEARLYNFIRFPVPSAVTAVAGTYVATIRYALSTQATFVLGSLTFDVEGDRGIVLGESLTLDQYNYLLERYSEVYDWATLRFLPLTGGTLTGDLTIDGHDLAAGRVFAKELWQQTNDALIMHYDGDSNEIRFGTTSGDFNPTFFGSLGVYMWDGRTKEYPTVRFDYYDGDGDYDETIEERVASQEWANAQYLKLTGGAVTGPVSFGSSVTANGYVQLNNGLTVSGSEIHGGTEYHTGNISLGNSGSDNSKTLNVYYTTNLRGPVTSSTILPGNVGFSIGGSGSGQRWNTIYSQYLDVTQSIKNSGNTYTFPSGSGVLATTAYVDNLVASVKANAYQVVQTLPQSGEEGIIYLVPVQGEDYYTQYIWEGNSWIDIGDTNVHLSGYLPLTGGTITGNLSIGGNLTITNSKLTNGTHTWTFPSKFGTVATVDDVDTLEGKITSGLITAQKARRDGNGNVIIDTYVRKADVIDNLASTATNKALSANQGKALNDRLTTAEGDIDDLEANKADKTGYYGTMGAGYADTAKSLQTSVGRDDETPFAFQTTGGSADVETGIQQLRKLIGASVVRNQLVRNGNFDNSESWSVRGGSFSVSGNEGTLTINDHGSANRLQQDNNTPIANHIYLFYFYIKSSTASVGFIDYGNTYAAAGNFSIGTSYSLVIKILQPTAGTDVFRIYVNNNDGYLTNGDTVSFKDVRVIDLTQRYGNNTVVNAIIGNDSSKYVEKLLQFDPSILKQTAYDAGTLASSQSAKLKSVGYNQWDEEWELGGINVATGQLETATDKIRSKNFIRVKGGTKYGFIKSGYAGDLMEYDANFNFIKTDPTQSNDTFTTDVNCCYLKFYMGTAYGTTYKHDICVFIYHDGSRVGYEPYESQTYDLPNIVQRGILKVDASGNVYADGDVAYPDGTGETEYTLINLGDLNWQKGDANSQRFYASVPTLVGWVNDASTADINSIISTGRYKAVILDAMNPSYYDNMYCVYTNHYIYILDKEKYASMTAAEFKAAMDGIYLVAKLATPTPITSDPFPENVWADDFGTTQFLDSDGNEIVGLQGAEFFYQANIAGFTESIYAREDIHGDPAKLVSHTELSASHYTKAESDARFALKEALGGTLRQLLAVKANIGFDNTNYIDMGTANWTMFTSGGGGYTVFRVEVSDLKTEANDSAMRNVLSTKYATSSWSDIYANGKDKVVSTIGTYIVVCDTSYSDADSFKAAMAGVLLAYEKAS